MIDISTLPEIKKIEGIIRSVTLQEIEVLTYILEEQLEQSSDNIFDRDNIHPYQLACKTVSHILFKICKDIAKMSEKPI